MFHDLIDWLKNRFGKGKNKTTEETLLNHKISKKDETHKNDEREVPKKAPKKDKRKKKHKIKAQPTILSAVVSLGIIIWWASMITANILTQEISLIANFAFTDSPLGISLDYDIQTRKNVNYTLDEVMYVSPVTEYLCETSKDCIPMIVNEIGENSVHLDFYKVKIPTWVSMEEYNKQIKKTPTRSYSGNRLKITGKLINNDFYITKIEILGLNQTI